MSKEKKYKDQTLRNNKISPYVLQKINYGPLLFMNMTLQKTIGNQEVQRMFQAGEIMAKMFVNQPGDRYEEEADRIARQIINPGDTQDQLDSPIFEIHKKETTPGEMTVPPESETQINSLKGKGQPLERRVRDYFKPRFGVDLKDVHIHTDSNADKLARGIKARAFTFGNDVVFARNEYKPDTPEGKKLIAHELTHVLQQNKALAGKTTLHKKDEPAWKRVQDFVSKKYEKKNHIPGTGIGYFDVSLNPSNGRLEIRQKLKFNFVDGSALDFTGTTESNTWTAAEKTSWKNSYIALIEGRWGGKYRFVNPDLPWTKCYVDVELEEVASQSHYEVNITKIPTGGFKGSFVAHYMDAATGKALDQSDKHYVNLDSEDLTFTDKGATEKQKGAIHEFGHMIGLGDEYNDGKPGVTHNQLYADALGIPGGVLINLIPEGTSNDIMSSGDSINKRHYVTFLEALKIITGMNNWKFE